MNPSARRPAHEGRACDLLDVGPVGVSWIEGCAGNVAQLARIDALKLKKAASIARHLIGASTDQREPLEDVTVLSLRAADQIPTSVARLVIKLQVPDTSLDGTHSRELYEFRPQ